MRRITLVNPNGLDGTGRLVVELAQDAVHGAPKVRVDHLLGSDDDTPLALSLIVVDDDPAPAASSSPAASK